MIMSQGAALAVLFIIAPVQACVRHLIYLRDLPYLSLEGCSSRYELGLIQGQTFGNLIRARVADSDVLQQILEYVGTDRGADTFARMRSLHESSYPLLWQELLGIAAGSNLPIDTVFALNLRNELLAASKVDQTFTSQQNADFTENEYQRVKQFSRNPEQNAHDLHTDESSLDRRTVSQSQPPESLHPDHEQPTTEQQQQQHLAQQYHSDQSDRMETIESVLSLSEKNVMSPATRGEGCSDVLVSLQGIQTHTSTQHGIEADPVTAQYDQAIQISQSDTAEHNTVRHQNHKGKPSQGRARVSQGLPPGVSDDTLLESDTRPPASMSLPAAASQQSLISRLAAAAWSVLDAWWVRVRLRLLPANKNAITSSSRGDDCQAFEDHDGASVSRRHAVPKTASGSDLESSHASHSAASEIPTTQSQSVVAASRGARDDDLAHVTNSAAVTGVATSGNEAYVTTMLAHNEDVSSDVVGRMYLLKAQLVGHPTWVALVYPGELASTAFGMNTAGLAFTLDALYPVQPFLPGVGRNWLSRGMLEALDVTSADTLLNWPGQATGRCINLLNYRTCDVSNVEVAPGGDTSTFAIPTGGNSWAFHANAYMRMDVSEHPGPSSRHRETVARRYALPTNAGDVLNLLGDDSDLQWPIYRTGLGGQSKDPAFTAYTILLTAVCGTDDGGTRYLVEGRAHVLQGNPREGDVLLTLDAQTLQPVVGPAHPSSSTTDDRWSSTP